MMKELHQSKTLHRVLWIGFGLIWFYLLGQRTLVPTDEGRYAEMAREMLASGDWITPRLNDVKYFFKPPLQTWMNAATFALFGLGEWQARFWTGLCGFLGIIFTALAATRVFGLRTGFYSALILASSFWWAAMGHINTLDMGLSGMMCIALSALLIAQRDQATPQERRNWMLICWAGMALAVLSKGLIGIVLPGAVLVLYTLITRDIKLWMRLHLGKGLLLFFAICTPWFVLVSLRNPEFPHFFFIHEHFERFLTKVHLRTGPWYYFIPLLVIGIMPWLAALAHSMLGALRRQEGQQFRPQLMLAIWAGFIFFFFSYSSSKLPSYILPIFPALAILIALQMERGKRSLLYATAGLVLLIAVCALPFVQKIGGMAQNPAETHLFTAFIPWVYAACATAIVGASLALWFARSEKRDHFVLALSLSGFVFGQLLMQGSEVGGRYRAGFEVIPTMQQHLRPGMPLYAVAMYDQCIPFYLQKTMIMVEHQDELAFGLSQEPHLWLPTRAAFLAKWNSDVPAMALTRHAVLKQFQDQGVPYKLIASDARRVVLLNAAAAKLPAPPALPGNQP